MDDQTAPEIEALLYSAKNPLSIENISDYTGKDKNEIKRTLKKLITEYSTRNTSLEIVRVGKRYMMQLKPQFYQLSTKVSEPEMTKYDLKVLSLVAGNPGITKGRIKKIVGEKTDACVEKLLNKRLLKTKKKGRSEEYFTGKEFSNYFGIDERKLDELRRKNKLGDNNGNPAEQEKSN